MSDRLSDDQLDARHDPRCAEMASPLDGWAVSDGERVGPCDCLVAEVRALREERDSAIEQAARWNSRAATLESGIREQLDAPDRGEYVMRDGLRSLLDPS